MGQDLLDIPGTLETLERDWAKGAESLNRVTAWNLASKLRHRLQLHGRVTSGVALFMR